MIDAQDVVEEEAMLEIWQEGNKWEHKIAWTKALPTGDSVIGDIKVDVTDALAETDWQNAHRMISCSDAHREVIREWDRGRTQTKIAQMTKHQLSTVKKLISQYRKKYPKYVMRQEERAHRWRTGPK